MGSPDQRPEPLRKLKVLQRERDSRERSNTTAFWGYVLLALTFVFFICSIYAIVVSNFMPMTGNLILDWIKEDTYYCLLVPVTIPVTIIAVYFAMDFVY